VSQRRFFACHRPDQRLPSHETRPLAPCWPLTQEPSPVRSAAVDARGGAALLVPRGSSEAEAIGKAVLHHSKLGNPPTRVVIKQVNEQGKEGE
jgi:hypothetical protein